MSAITNRIRRLAVMMAGAGMVLAGGALAQGVPCPTPPKPYGGQMLDVSRDLTGIVTPAITYFYICPNAAGNGQVTRHTYRQPIHLDLSNTTGCDELPVKMTLDGYYYSQTRMTDPWTNPVPNARIGWHNGFGTIKDSAGNVIATAKFEGTIGTNTSRPPMKEGVGSCFDCGHHTGLMVITFLSTATVANKQGVIKAFYQFDAMSLTGASCDQADPCDTGFSIDGGTLDGINQRVCQ